MSLPGVKVAHPMQSTIDRSLVLIRTDVGSSPVLITNSIYRNIDKIHNKNYGSGIPLCYCIHMFSRVQYPTLVWLVLGDSELPRTL